MKRDTAYKFKFKDRAEILSLDEYTSRFPDAKGTMVCSWPDCGEFADAAVRTITGIECVLCLKHLKSRTNVRMIDCAMCGKEIPEFEIYANEVDETVCSDCVENRRRAVGLASETSAPSRLAEVLRALIRRTGTDGYSVWDNEEVSDNGFIVHDEVDGGYQVNVNKL